LTGVPYVHEWPLGLEGQAGSHMNLRSSRIFLDRLMPRVLSLPEVANVVRTDRPSTH
jgi:hypothetical protein